MKYEIGQKGIYEIIVKLEGLIALFAERVSKWLNGLL
jgi:hypothetical protein